MKSKLLCLVSAVLLFCAMPPSHAAYVVKKASCVQNTVSQASQGDKQGEKAMGIINTIKNYVHALPAAPRGRGNGDKSKVAFLYGLVSLIPFLGVFAAIAALIIGIPCMRKHHKKRGLATAGVVLACVGIVITAALIIVIASL